MSMPLPANVTLNPQHRMSDDQFFEFCMAHPDQRFERTAQGEIIIVPPAGGESDYQNVKVISQLDHWAERDGRGQVFGCSTGFILPTGATLSPDAAWVSKARLERLSREQRRKFLPVCPEFVVEVMSPSDRLSAAKKKMQEWIRAGVELAWLMHGDQKTIYIYRAGHKEPEKRTGILKVAGEGPVSGFNLDLRKVWDE